MKTPFRTGDSKTFERVVTTGDVAAFESGTVHEVYSTFALARDAEWSGRLFVLEMKEEQEEGIGTGITIHHHSPAFVGEKVLFTSVLSEVKGNEVITDYSAHVGSRLIADGRQWQKILPKEKLKKIMKEVRK